MAATTNGADIDISWNAVNNATLYRLYSATGSGDFTEITAAAGAATTYSHTGLAPNTTTRYQVVACLNMQMDSCSPQSGSVTATTAPPVPVLDVAERGTTIRLSWSAVDGATYYRPYSSTSPEGDYAEIPGAAGSALTYDHAGLEPATDYYHRLAACTTAEPNTCSAPSAVRFKSTTTVSPPRGLTATATGYNITVSWNAVEGATRYILYRNTLTVTRDISAPETSYIDMNVGPFTTIWYEMRACHGTRFQTCSPQTGRVTATTVPALPTTLNAIPIGTTVELSWESVRGATHYRLYTSDTVNGDYTEIQAAAGSGSRYHHTDLDPRTDYYYRLAACITAEVNTCSPQSSPPLKATTTLTAPATPTVTLMGTTANLAWEMATGATHYQVWRGTRAGGMDRVLLTGGSGQPDHPDMDTLSFSDPHVGSSTTWYYWLRGCDAEGCSDFSGRSDPLNYADGVHLNDTGINFGGNVSGNASDCTSNIVDSDSAMIPQDCSQGRDGEAAASALAKAGAGIAGYDFTRLDTQGAPLADQTASWAEENWACVRDNHTGLVWEVKTTASGIHNKDGKYAWGGLTAEGRDSTLAESEKGVYSDDWNRLVEGSNSGNGLCGLTNWRAPTIKELTGIARAQSTDAATNPFPNLPPPNVSFWSATPRSSLQYHGMDNEPEW